MWYYSNVWQSYSSKCLILIVDHDHEMTAGKDPTKTLKLLISFLFLLTYSNHQKEPMGITSHTDYDDIICGKQKNRKRLYLSTEYLVKKHTDTHLYYNNVN